MLEAGQILHDRYQLQHQLGENAARQTWLATDLQATDTQNTQVVVKFLAFGGQVQWEDLKLFEREAQVLKQLNFPQIPKYYDYFCVDDRLLWFCLVQEYIPGASLKQLLTQGKRFTEKQVKKIAIDVLNILTHLHELNPQVLHRDIKPSNLILSADEQIYLVDFGAVQDKAAKEGMTFTVVGTYGYTPMEQFGGRAVPASDLYALGASLIHLLTGVAPADLPQRDLRIQFSDKVGVNASLVSWLEQMTQPSVERRFSSAGEALAALSSNSIVSKMTYMQRLPLGSRIKLSKSPNYLSIQLPRQRMTVLDKVAFIAKLVGIAVLAMMIGFGTLATLFATSMLGVVVIVGVWLAWWTALDRILLSAWGHQQIHFNRDGFVIELWLFNWCRNTKHGPTKAISDVFQSVLRVTSDKSFLQEGGLEQEMVTIQAQKQRYSFGLGLSAAECVWLAQEIKDWLEMK